MASVVNPEGTGFASHLQGIDFAGKTGSTQLVSHEFLKRMAARGRNVNELKNEFKGNGWFAGVTPRRNPEIVVVVFLDGGEHGPLAAHVASLVIKAYVEKERRVRNNPMLFSDKADPGSVPIAGVWSAPADGDSQDHEVADAEDHFQGGTLLLKMGAARLLSRPKPAPPRAVGSSGVN
jgi:penicillin-binding protein 2